MIRTTPRPPAINTSITSSMNIPLPSPHKPADTPEVTQAKNKFFTAKKFLDTKSPDGNLIREMSQTLPTDPSSDRPALNRHVDKAIGMHQDALYANKSERRKPNPTEADYSNLYKKSWKEETAKYELTTPGSPVANAKTLALPDRNALDPHYYIMSNKDGLIRPTVEAHAIATAQFLESRRMPKNYQTKTFYGNGREYFLVNPITWEYHPISAQSAQAPMNPRGTKYLDPYPDPNPLAHLNQPDGPDMAAASRKYLKAKELALLNKKPNKTNAERAMLNAYYPRKHGLTMEPDSLEKRATTLAYGQVFDGTEHTTKNLRTGERANVIEASRDEIPKLNITVDRYQPRTSVTIYPHELENATFVKHTHPTYHAASYSDHRMASKNYLNNKTQDSVMTGKNDIITHPTRFETIRMGTPGTTPPRSPTDPSREIAPWDTNRFINYDGLGGIEKSKTGIP